MSYESDPFWYIRSLASRWWLAGDKNKDRDCQAPIPEEHRKIYATCAKELYRRIQVTEAELKKLQELQEAYQKGLNDGKTST